MSAKKQGKAEVNAEVKGSKGQERTRNFAFLVYPDSAPPDWPERLNEAHVECLISPLHDKDTNPDGTPKKPHWHVLVMYSSVKTWEQACKLRDAVGGVGREEVASVRGYARYLCHLDNPEKASYSMEDVVELGGADYNSLIRRAADGTKAVRDMMLYIRESGMMFFCDFMDYCMDNRPDWYETLLNGSMYPVYTYIKAIGAKAEVLARANKRPKDEEKEKDEDTHKFIVDESTGEIIGEEGGLDHVGQD